MPRILYEERQGFGWWVYALVGVAALGALLAFALAVMFGGGESLFVPQNVLLVLLLAGSVVLVNALYMITRVTDREIFVQFGRVFPVFRARIPLGDVTDFRSVQYRPIRDAGGWGIRGGHFEGARCRFYNVKGDRAVFVDTPKRRYIIGSQSPERFAAAIENALTRDEVRRV